LTNFLPLFAGRPVELVAEGPGVEGLVAALRRGPGWSLLKLTPAHVALLEPALTATERAASARGLVIGADQVSGELTHAWQTTAPGVTLINEYGPTETVVGCSSYQLPAARTPVGPVPIGRPIANLTMYVLDEGRQVTPVGVVGELYIGGVGVARGYWRR